MLKNSLEENKKKYRAREMELEREILDKKDQLVQQMHADKVKKEKEIKERLKDELHHTTKRVINENLQLTTELNLISYKAENLVTANGV